MAHAHSAPSETQAATLSTQDAGRARILLLVDDEEILLRAIGKMLRKRGFTVLTATNGTDAVDLLRMHKNDISLVFLDVTLPGLPSREVLEEARRIRTDMPVILTSAHGRNVVDSLFAGVPVAHFIGKPYRLAALVDLIQSVLSKP